MQPSRDVRLDRMRLGLTQSQLADLLGVTLATVSRWERGVSPPDPGALTLLLILRDVPDALGPRLQEALTLRGGLYALYVLLDNHFTTNPPRT